MIYRAVLSFGGLHKRYSDGPLYVPPPRSCHPVVVSWVLAHGPLRSWTPVKIVRKKPV
ncbi:hypothetical protein J6590_005455 [Homalodisca vitripennis]|nr:hypothetical protein J6590_005455 [Homalodisca vitripennis]